MRESLNITAFQSGNGGNIVRRIMKMFSGTLYRDILPSLRRVLTKVKQKP